MEQTTFEISVAEEDEISVAEEDEPGGSAPPTVGSVPPTSGHDTSVRASLATYCDRLKLTEIQRNNLAAVWIKYEPTPDVLGHINPKTEHTESFYFNDDGRLAREGRKLAAERFTSQYVYGRSMDGCNDTMEQRTCIWSEDTCLWLEKSSGITWVGVHGADSVCVVTRSGDLDKERLLGNLKILTVQDVLAIFRKSVICEFEDVADPSSNLHQRFCQSIKKPFGVVSANPGTNDIHKRSHEASSAGYDEKQAIEFLLEKMKCDTNFTVSETTKTAICAFQRLFRKKLNATEIAVSVLDPEYYDPTIKELQISEVEKYLAIIDKSGQGDIEEHSDVIDDPGTSLKKQRMSTPVPSSGGSSNTSGTTD